MTLKFLIMIKQKNKFFLLFLMAVKFASAQPGKIIDQVAAVVGNKIILRSDIEQQYIQYIGQGNYANEKVQCEILDQLLMSKLLLNQAIFDSTRAVGGSFCAATHYWEFSAQSIHPGDPNVGDQLRRLVDRAVQDPSVNWRTVGDTLTQSRTLL